MIESNKQGISIIISTNKLGLINNIVENYKRQQFVNKELILILHNNQQKIEEFEKYKKEDTRVQIYSIDENISPGLCMNFATEKARYNYIAIFDDDYYGPRYLEEAYQILSAGRAAVTEKYLPCVFYGSESIIH